MAANAEYSKLLLRFNQAQQDLALFQSDAQQFCLQKEKEMEILREKLSLLRGNYGMAEQWTLEQTMLNSPVITELHEQASKTSKPSRAQWVDLLSLAERELPLLYKKLASSEPPLTDQEMIAALLIRLQFTQGELASLLGVSKQRVNNIKRNINKKIFQQEGAVTLNGNIFSI
jgi:DNA-binding CsgD family transcriptional regulator